MSDKRESRLHQPGGGEPRVAVVNTQGLYEKHRTVYARSVSGVFNNWRWIMVFFTQAIFYGLCWLDWGGRQAVLFHLVERKFYIFGMVFWPQDAIYLAVLLVISAYLLFLVTAVGGRLFCGYACPQTVYTEILMWIERKVEGERPARMKLDAQPMDARKFRIKFTKHALWLMLSLWTGFTFVGYFSPIRELGSAVVSFSLGPWELFWVFFYAGFLYMMAGFLREQVCKYMCPYARFQGVMFDPDTLIITYDDERGEPRAPRRKGEDAKAAGKGDCIDCGICVQVCPTGIDIRKGLQYECIACAACIDACDEVMEKVGYPKGLIRYSTQNSIDGKNTRVLRPRILVYGAILLALMVGWGFGVSHRDPLIAEVLRDRNALFRETAADIENGYTLKLVNKTDADRSYRVRIESSGKSGLTLKGEPLDVRVPAGAVVSQEIEVGAPVDVRGRHALTFVIEADDGSAKARIDSTFFGPM